MYFPSLLYIPTADRKKQRLFFTLKKGKQEVHGLWTFSMGRGLFPRAINFFISRHVSPSKETEFSIFIF